jgi:hypothetical protein
MFWIFASVVLVLMVYHEPFRKFALILAALVVGLILVLTLHK